MGFQIIRSQLKWYISLGLFRVVTLKTSDPIKRLYYIIPNYEAPNPPQDGIDSIITQSRIWYQIDDPLL